MLEVHRHKDNIGQKEDSHDESKDDDSRLTAQLYSKVCHETVLQSFEEIFKERLYIVPDDHSYEQELSELKHDGVEKFFLEVGRKEVIDVSFNVVTCVCVIIHYASNGCEDFDQTKYCEDESKDLSYSSEL